jgi:hypothetical protein
MTDFNFYDWDGYAYITPLNSVTGPTTGMSATFLYVYKGGGAPARLAGCTPPVGTLTVADGGAGNVQAGVHVLAVAFETDTGYISQIAAFASYQAAGSKVAHITNIPVSGDPFVVARRLVATISIDPSLFSGNIQDQYQFFFIPDGRIADNVTTTHDSSFFDSELLQDASYTLNLFTKIPAPTGLTVYNNRLISYGEYANTSLVRASYVGQPEAFDQVNGFMIVPLDGHVLTNAQAYQGVLYVFKATRTVAYSDNNEVPSTWPLTVIDEGIGASIHGVATVLDSGGVNITNLLIIDFSGVMIFTGIYQRPELSWKVRDYWFSLSGPSGMNRLNFQNFQIVNDSISQLVIISLPSVGVLLVGDYSNGMDFKDIKWAKWSFNPKMQTITLINTNKLILGANG